MIVLLIAAERTAVPQAVALVLMVPAAVLLFSLAMRKRLSMKNFLLHPANVLTSKLHQSFEVDMSADLIFEKMQEVISDSKYKLAATDPATYTVLATAPMTIWSWGENIYITITPHGEQSLVNITSVAFQVYSWGKNEDNFRDIVTSFEKSLIV
jgi:hypothetical protein